MGRNKVQKHTVALYDENGKPIGGAVGSLVGSKYSSEEPPYVKTYLNDLGYVMKVSNTDISVFLHLIKYMTYGNIVDINPRIKKKIIKDMGVGSLSSITNNISHLKKAFLILPVSRGSYLIDPKYCGKGSWVDIHKIQMHITYHPDGSKTVSADFDKKDEPKQEKKDDIKPDTNFDNSLNTK